LQPDLFPVKIRAMSTQGQTRQPEEIREAQLPRSLRGYDEGATRQLLAEIADGVQALMTERDTLREQVGRLENGHREDDESPEALGNALLAAKRAGEVLIAEARMGAEQITARAKAEGAQLLEEARRATADVERNVVEQRAELEVEQQRLRQEAGDWRKNIDAESETLLAQARADGEAIVSESRRRLDELRLEAEKLERFIGDRQRQLVELLQSALEQLDGLGPAIALSPEAADRNLSDALKPTVRSEVELLEPRRGV
jgi:cell division septum initiation protein DivIVA